MNKEPQPQRADAERARKATLAEAETGVLVMSFETFVILNERGRAVGEPTARENVIAIHWIDEELHSRFPDQMAAYDSACDAAEEANWEAPQPPLSRFFEDIV